MTYEYLKNLKTTNQTLKLLNADNFAFILSFFHFVFEKNRLITITHSKILQYLDDYLFMLNQDYNEVFAKEAKHYLEDFTNAGYLKKYYGDDEEPIYEMTPHTQKALEWIEGLEKKEFVGSRSKFNIIFELLEDLEFEAKLNDKQRIKKLKNQKKEIDKQIEAIESKRDLRFDSSRIKEHFMQIEEIARKLKYDFSEIEYNFRDLNSHVMEQIATKDDYKGEILGSIFEEEDKIRDSDQGKSFFAFWQLLTDAKRNEKLSLMLENLYEMQTIKEFDRDKKLRNLKYDLLQSGEKVSKVSSKLIEQLRRFLDDRIWIENRRILELCKSIEKSAIEIKTKEPKNRNFFYIKDDKVKINSIFSKSLYKIKETQEFKNEIVQKEIEIDMESFYNQFFVDEEDLKRNIKNILLHQRQCTTLDIVKKFTVKKGVAELIGYISIAKNSDNAIVDDKEKQIISVVDNDGIIKNIKMPKIIFSR